MLRLMLKAGIDPNEVSAAELTAKQPEEFRTTTISDRQAEGAQTIQFSITYTIIIFNNNTVLQYCSTVERFYNNVLQ